MSPNTPAADLIRKALATVIERTGSARCCRLPRDDPDGRPEGANVHSAALLAVQVSAA